MEEKRKILSLVNIVLSQLGKIELDENCLSQMNILAELDKKWSLSQGPNAETETLYTNKVQSPKSTGRLTPPKRHVGSEREWSYWKELDLLVKIGVSVPT